MRVLPIFQSLTHPFLVRLLCRLLYDALDFELELFNTKAGDGVSEVFHSARPIRQKETTSSKRDDYFPRAHSCR